MRRALRDPAPAAAPPRADARTYRFLTPVFGGGVLVDAHEKHADPVTPVRAASIRGQLRFWWRACNPRRCETVEALREEEAKIFGSAQAASRLSIAVTKQAQRPERFEVLVDGEKFGAARGREALAYGAFPLRATKEPYRHGVLHQYAGDWEVSFSYDAGIRDDVEAALWAWAHFGGLGGRTRRGFGAIEQTTPRLPSIAEGWSLYVRGLSVPWPHIGGDRARSVVARRASFDSGLAAQEFLLGRLSDLRQKRTGRNPEPDDMEGRHPGRSYWPEADAVRSLLGIADPNHARPVTTVRAFPRAAFGLPIILHFKSTQDPPETTLLPLGRGRLASRLVLRPHRNHDGAVEAMAMVLSHPAPEAIELCWKDESRSDRREPVRTTVSETEAREMGIGGRPSPLVVRTSNKVFVDPIERFLEEIR